MNTGEYFLKKLSVLKKFSIVGDIRGKGLLIGIEFMADKKGKVPFEKEIEISKKISIKAFAKGLIVQPGNGGIDGTLGDHIILVPPFIIKETEIDKTVEILEEVFFEVQESLQI